MKKSVGLGGFEILGGSESKEVGYDSDKVRVSKETQKRLGHFANRGFLFKSNSIF